MRAAVLGRGLRAPLSVSLGGQFSFTRPGASGVMPGRRASFEGDSMRNKSNKDTIVILMIINAFLWGLLIGSVVSWRVLP